MQATFVIDGLTARGVQIPRLVLNVSGNSVPEMRRDLAEVVATRHHLPVGAVIDRCRLSYLAE